MIPIVFYVETNDFVGICSKSHLFGILLDQGEMCQVTDDFYLSWKDV